MSPKPKILSPFETWQSLFTYLFEHHYGLALNDTPFHDVEVMAEHINTGVTPLEAVNSFIERYDLSRIDRSDFSLIDQIALLSDADINRAQQAIGLLDSNILMGE